MLTGGNNRCPEHQARIDALNNARHEQLRRAVKKETKQYMGDYAKRAKEVRLNALFCHLCGEGAKWNDPWQADHIIPSDPNSPLAPAHRSCNARRGNKPLS